MTIKKMYKFILSISLLLVTQLPINVLAGESNTQEGIDAENTHQVHNEKETQDTTMETDFNVLEEISNMYDDEEKENIESSDKEESQKEENETKHFDDPIFKRDLINEVNFSLLFINDEYVILTEKEAKEYERKLSNISDIENLSLDVVRLMLKEIITQQKKDYIPVVGASFDATNHFSWDNWQNESIANGQPLNNQYPIKINNASRWRNTNSFRAIVSKIGETYPVVNIRRNSIHVANATNINNPNITLKLLNGSPTTYYNFNRTDRGPNATSNGNTIIGTQEYVNRNGKYIDMKFPLSKELNIQPSIPTTIEFEYKIEYNTPAKNGFNNNLSKPINQTILNVIRPQVVKTIHIEKETGKILKNIESHSGNGYYLNPIELSKKDFSGYEYSHYEVLEEKQFKERSQENTWKGVLNQQKRAIVFYYNAKPKTYRVSFESNGGTNVSQQIVEEGKKAKKPSPDPKFDNKRFRGWYTDKELSIPYDFEKPVNSDITLYAKWESPIVNPENGKTPVTPLNPENQNKKREGLRIQYVSDFEFGEKEIDFQKELRGHAQGDIVIEDSKQKRVPTFISIIDDRPTTSNKNGWELRAMSSPFVTDKDDQESINNAAIYLSELNYASGLETTPVATDGELNISSDLQMLSNSGNTKGGTWSLAFGYLDNEKSTGTTIKIPKGTKLKSNVDYYSVIKWELTPSLGGR